MSSEFVFPYCHLEVALSSSASTERKNATRYCHCTAFSTTCAMLPPSPVHHLTEHPEPHRGTRQEEGACGHVGNTGREVPYITLMQCYVVFAYMVILLSGAEQAGPGVLRPG